MISLTLHGGHREIGGNKFLLESGGDGLFLDFGKSFVREAMYFDIPWNPPFHVPSLLAIGALPDLPGLYRHEPGRPIPVLLSHVHQDHSGYLSLLAPGTIVYTGEDTKNILEIRTEAGRDRWDVQLDHLEWRTFRSGERVAVEGTDFAFTPIHVDYSVPAAYAFIVETAGMTIGYTGDLRMHGARPDLTLDFIKELNSRHIDVLLCEGTRVVSGEDPDDQFLREMGEAFKKRTGEAAPAAVHVSCATEKDVQLQLSGVLKDACQLALIEVSPIDIDRMRSVWQAAKEAGRKVVLPSRQAYIIYQAAVRTRIGELPPVSDTVLYLAQRRRSARDRKPGEPEDSEEFLKGRDRWEQDLATEWERGGGDVCWGEEGRAELRMNGERYVVCSPDVASVLPELCYRAETCPVTFVLSKSEPFNEEMLLSFDKLLHWLAFYGCSEYYHMHVSGHAPPEDLRRIIEAANPNKLIPIHTRFPEVFSEWHYQAIVDIRQGELHRLSGP